MNAQQAKVKVKKESQCSALQGDDEDGAAEEARKHPAKSYEALGACEIPRGLLTWQ